MPGIKDLEGIAAKFVKSMQVEVWPCVKDHKYAAASVALGLWSYVVEGASDLTSLAIAVCGIMADRQIHDLLLLGTIDDMNEE